VILVDSDKTYYDQSDMLEFFYDALAHGRKDDAATILKVMASSCPLYKAGVCLESFFCPDCKFYLNNGVIIPMRRDSAEKTIQVHD